MSQYARDVRFGSKADIPHCNGHVRFTPKSGHSAWRVACPLSANSGHARSRPQPCAAWYFMKPGVA
jgi:hypothetical protein